MWGDNDQNDLKFVILYFIHTVVFSSEKKTKEFPSYILTLLKSVGTLITRGVSISFVDEEFEKEDE